MILYAGTNKTCIYVYTIEDYLLEGNEKFTIYFYIDYTYYYPDNICVDSYTSYIKILDDESE